MGGWRRSLMWCGFALLLPVGLEAQAGPAPSLNLFFDCQAPGCRDLDYMRRQAPWVNWVRDREASDVHVLVTSQATGGGGRQYTLAFLGRGAFEGVDQDLTHSTAGDATNDENREAVAEKLKLGLVRYVATTPIADALRITFQAPDADEGDGEGQEQDDPWDFWRFGINVNGGVNGESTSSFSNFFGNVSANRVTEAWKVNLSVGGSRFVRTFEAQIDSITTITESFVQRDWNASGTVVRSVGEQWALGIRGDIGAADFLNEDFRLSVKPGAEFNFFPYAESSRRSVTLQYLVGPFYRDYNFRTIFGKTWETRMQQSLTGRISLVEPWGQWSTSVTGEQFLHDLEKYSVTVSGDVNIRLFRGFSIRFGGRYSWIRDQLHISSERLDEADVLLRRRQLATSFRYFTNFGIQYQFGSIFNNVVNPRFGRSGGEFFFF